jgi:hypothetical protein
VRRAVCLVPSLKLLSCWQVNTLDSHYGLAEIEPNYYMGGSGGTYIKLQCGFRLECKASSTCQFSFESLQICDGASCQLTDAVPSSARGNMSVSSGRLVDPSTLARNARPLKARRPLA